MPRNKRIVIYTTEEQFKKIQQKAKRQNMSISSFILLVIEHTDLRINTLN